MRIVESEGGRLYRLQLWVPTRPEDHVMFPVLELDMREVERLNLEQLAPAQLISGVIGHVNAELVRIA